MIARVWRGWTSPANADAYENLLRTTILPSFKEIAGYSGGMIYRADGDDVEIEFVITNFFDSLDALRSFAGSDDYTQAVIEPEARALLSRVEPVAKHYDVREFGVRDGGMR